MDCVFLKTKGNVLFPGGVSDELFYLLMNISAVRSSKVISALQDYFVNGNTRNVICEKHNINPGYLSIKIRELQSLSRLIMDAYPFLSKGGENV